MASPGRCVRERGNSPPFNEQTQGLRYLSTLTGLIFLSHQMGSFLGTWPGGRTYDIQRVHGLMWWVAIVPGLLATLIHLPVRETPGPLALEEAG